MVKYMNGELLHPAGHDLHELRAMRHPFLLSKIEISDSSFLLQAMQKIRLYRNARQGEKPKLEGRNLGSRSPQSESYSSSKKDSTVLRKMRLRVKSPRASQEISLQASGTEMLDREHRSIVRDMPREATSGVGPDDFRPSIQNRANALLRSMWIGILQGSMPKKPILRKNMQAHMDAR